MNKEQFRKDVCICKKIYDKGTLRSDEEIVNVDDAIFLAKRKVDGDETVNNELRVLIKATLINSLYSTRIFGIVRMSKHISQISDFDGLVEKGDITVIDKIRNGHGIKSNRENKKRKEIDFYSFATKYANWHAQDKFPIYDRFVSELLYDLNKTFEFYKPKFTWNDLKCYEKFKNVVDRFRDEFQLIDYNYKQIDKALWIFAEIGRLTKKIRKGTFKNEIEKRNAEDENSRIEKFIRGRNEDYGCFSKRCTEFSYG